MRKHDQLYFLAIVPPLPLKNELQLLKTSFAEKYNCKAALKSPPHITLHMPFRFQEKKEDILLEHLNKLTGITPFPVHLNNFGCFSPKVIYVKVENTSQLNLLFDKLQFTMKGLNVFNAGYKNRGFNPHLTIAFRDLKKSVFPMAWDTYKNETYSENFLVENFMLLKHNGKHWEEFQSITLNNS